ncbi:hypothetical protein CHS0354_016749 [Potamilus streckersoni]|uniref:Cyclic nucleotide-binding domain-containing protein n=1 Tax=Potamilus streckersoni TaxID=2493646 RepID=A0AAE0TC97_9BIVA|nr:hypothetical protein CHS0354_016749 [Potamilus streckersoni]
MEELGLSFDKSYYKAKKEISLSQEVRKILTTRGQYRTQRMVKQAMNGLQTLRFLSEYPLKTQEKLCTVAWYQTIETKKTIIKQGHDAESFYLILSGNAFMKKITRDEKTKELKVHTIARLGKGQSFGEVGLIFNTKRTATVESATPMEVLVIGKEDFIRIFMDSEHPDKEAEHIGFLRQVPLFQNWPIESIKEEPGSCLINYYKRGTLVTDNDQTSEWFYIVKSGTCEVMKTLKAVKARKPNEIKPKEDPVSEINLSRLGMPNNGPRIDTGRRRPKRNLCRMIQSTIQEKYRLSSSSDEKEDNHEKQSHVFVNVEILQSKDVFGLNTLLHAMEGKELYEGENESPVMMLVSRGAEIILFSKKMFLKHMNHTTLMTLKNFARFYPSESVMQDSMQTEADWVVYRNIVFKESLDNRLTRRTQSAVSERQ